MNFKTFVFMILTFRRVDPIPKNIGLMLSITFQTQGLKVCDKDGKTRFMDLSSLPKQGIKYGDLLPTPVASDHTGSCTIRKMTKSNGAPRTDSLRNMPAVIGMDGDRLNGRVFQLSPLFVEEMMGYPLMWTTLPFLTGNGEKNQ